ncbi:MAG: Flp pilus assembly complex ATPase component TadA, partial [Candidatus Omnitrophica bacterium]|nr:Flp pilus assembly complex ATPase component TadA [Candidatus Omnitrophota bacterium]
MRSSHLKQRLSDLLIKNNLITEEQLKTAIDTQRQKGGQLSGIFVELGFITEKDLVRILSQEFKMPPINLSRINIDPKVVQIIPVQIARFYQTLPISLLKNQLTLVLADPLNVLALDEIKTITGYEINPVLATEAEIIQAIDKCYSESSEEGMGQILDDINKSEVEIVEGKHPGDQEQESTSELLKLVDEAPVIKITNKLLLDAVKNKASDLFIEPMEKTMRIRCRLDGIIVEFKSPPKSMHNAIISRIKVLSNLDISEHRLPQDGRFKIKINKEEINFRVSIIPSILGEKAVLRVLDNTSVALDLNTLGFEAHDLETIREALTHPYGMMLVSGPTGSGKTTTLYSMLGYVNSPEKNLVTVEDPVEYQLEGINQVPV